MIYIKKLKLLQKSDFSYPPSIPRTSLYYMHDTYQQIFKSLKNYAKDESATVGLAIDWSGSRVHVNDMRSMYLLHITSLDYESWL